MRNPDEPQAVAFMRELIRKNEERKDLLGTNGLPQWRSEVAAERRRIRRLHRGNGPLKERLR